MPTNLMALGSVATQQKHKVSVGRAGIFCITPTLSENQAKRAVLQESIGSYDP